MKSSIAALPFLLGLFAVAGLEGGDSPQATLTAAQRAQLENTTIEWPSLNTTSENPHIVFGAPSYATPDNQHQMTRDYHGFTVFYDDQILASRWTCIKLTKDMADANGSIDRESSFSTDIVLKDAGLLVTKHADYNNPPGSKAWARGHMVQFDDARGWGVDAAKDSFLTSNITPQLQAHNSGAWLALEKLCTEYARDYKVVWVYTGPIYTKNPKPFASGRKIPKPTAFYKVLISPGDSGTVDVLAFIVPHKAMPQSTDVSQFLASIDEVEKRTGLDFLRDLPDPVEDVVESIVWEMWPNI